MNNLKKDFLITTLTLCLKMVKCYVRKEIVKQTTTVVIYDVKW